ncbi:MAG: hypothetical protein RMJ28_02780 [Nitrososphaerota archaeon]|nr:hypothetical protein [Candidatus Calditenuaceae archaeon]MDW8073145.1 hypothetical protein [Nitrososphaerota archaeon]
MRSYRCRLKILSPTIIGDSRSQRGVYTATHIIPGHTLGGAINRELARKYELSSMTSRGLVISSPAYPAREGSEAIPAHPFYYECKVCDDLRFSTLREGSLLKVVKDGLTGVRNEVIMLKCGVGHLLKSLHPRPIMLIQGKVVKTSVLVQPLISVGINRHTASSQTGLLYEYTAIEPGREYWFTLASIDDLEVPNKLEVRLGRGTSRGFGRALIEVIEREVKFSYDIEPDSWIMMYALSPVPARYINKRLELKESANNYGLGGVDGSLEPVMVFGKLESFNLGWPHGSPVSRGRITCLVAGSVIIYRWAERPTNPLESLRVLRFLGMPLRLTTDVIHGLCMLHPFREEPLLEVR